MSHIMMEAYTQFEFLDGQIICRISGLYVQPSGRNTIIVDNVVFSLIGVNDVIDSEEGIVLRLIQLAKVRLPHVSDCQN